MLEGVGETRSSRSPPPRKSSHVRGVNGWFLGYLRLYLLDESVSVDQQARILYPDTPRARHAYIGASATMSTTR